MTLIIENFLELSFALISRGGIENFQTNFRFEFPSNLSPEDIPHRLVLSLANFFFFLFTAAALRLLMANKEPRNGENSTRNFPPFVGLHRVTMRMSFPLHRRCWSLIMMVGLAFETARVSEREICHSRPWPRLPGKKWVSRFVCAQWRARLLHCDRN